MVTVRKARLKDVDTITQLWEEFMKQHDSIVLKENPKLKPYLLKKSKAAEAFKRFATNCVWSKNAVIYIAEVSGRPAGYSLSFIKKNIPVFSLEKIGYMSDIFVRPEYMGKGISSMLKKETIKWFKKKGLKHVSIMVNAENKHAYNIYRKWGFLNYHLEMRMKI